MVVICNNFIKLSQIMVVICNNFMKLSQIMVVICNNFIIKSTFYNILNAVKFNLDIWFVQAL